MDTFTQSLQRPGKMIKKLGNKILCTLDSSHFKPFIVLSRSRTGSNMLISFLENHPDVHAEREILNKLNGRNYKELLAKGFHRKSHKIKASGFKIFYYHPLDDKSCPIWDDLVKIKKLSIIHLKRRNILRTLISREIASNHDTWLATSRKKVRAIKNKAVTFDVETLKIRFNRTKEWEAKGDEMFKNHPLLHVCYEDMVRDPEGIFAKITDFLDIPYIQPETNLKRQNPESMKVLLKNYDELKSAFNNTKWESFFED